MALGVSVVAIFHQGQGAKRDEQIKAKWTEVFEPAKVRASASSRPKSPAPSARARKFSSIASVP
jgi:hypothetical protein